jgi:hypothetical protein
MQTLHSSKTSFVDVGQSVMTKLLADSLAGNALTLMIGTLKQGELAESEAVLKHLQVHESSPNQRARQCALLQCMLCLTLWIVSERYEVEYAGVKRG